jgi:hypothetical protein
MVRNQWSLRDGVVLEEVGAELLVYLPGKSAVFRLLGEDARFVSALRRGDPLIDYDASNLSSLLDSGIIVSSRETSGNGADRRRFLITAGSLGLGGLATLALPVAAVASSPIELFGRWFADLSVTYFELSRITYPFLPARAFLGDSTYNYSSLALSGQDVVVYPFGDEVILWGDSSTKFPGLSGTVRGTFTVNSITYIGVFSPPPP